LPDIDTETAINVLQTVNTYVLGAVLRELGELRTQLEQEEWVSGDTDFPAKLQQWRARLAATGMFDHFLRILRDDVDPDAEETRDGRIEFGLDCVLECVAAKLAKGLAENRTLNSAIYERYVVAEWSLVLGGAFLSHSAAPSARRRRLDSRR
jgi:hypothetical protein